MYDFLEGHLTHISLDAVVQLPCFILNINGIGYQVYGLQRQANTLQHQTGQTLRLYCRLALRQQPDPALFLYGFEQRAERDLFNLLLSANGIGPKAALALLEALSIEQLVQAIITGNEDPLTQAKGIGKKGAQKLVLELKEKMTACLPLLTQTPLNPSAEAAPTPHPLTPNASATHSLLNSLALTEAQAVLTSLGYSPQEQSACWHTLPKLAETNQLPHGIEPTSTPPHTWSSETLLRYALKWLALTPSR